MIDYDALEEQVQGQSTAPVDYDALEKQARTARPASAKPPSRTVSIDYDALERRARTTTQPLQNSTMWTASHQLPEPTPLKPGETRDRGVFVGNVPLDPNAGTMEPHPRSILDRIVAPIREGAIGRALGISTETAEARKEDPGTPLIKFEAAEDPNQRGVIHAINTTASGFTTPENLLLMASTSGVGALSTALGKAGVSKLISLGFSADMLWDAVKHAPEFAKQVKAGDWTAASETLTRIALQAGMSAKALQHGMAADVHEPQVSETMARDAASPFKDPGAPYPAAPRVPQSVRRASVAPPETGIPEGVARGQYARNKISQQVMGKPFSALSNSERLAVDELVVERNRGNGVRDKAGTLTPDSFMQADSAPQETVLPEPPIPTPLVEEPPAQAVEPPAVAHPAPPVAQEPHGVTVLSAEVPQPPANPTAHDIFQYGYDRGMATGESDDHSVALEADAYTRSLKPPSDSAYYNIKAAFNSGVAKARDEQYRNSHDAAGNPIAQPDIPPEASQGVAAPSPAPEERTALPPIWEMNSDEVDREHRAAKNRDQVDLIDIFGPSGAKLYLTLERQANGSSANADAAANKLAEMEAALPLNKQQRLYGVGQSGPSLDVIKDYKGALGRLDPTSAETLGASLQYAIPRLPRETTDPAQMTHAERLAYAQVREAWRIAEAEGFDLGTVQRSAIKSAAARFPDPQDAEFMIGRFLATEKQPSLAGNTANTAIPPKEPVSPAGSPAEVYTIKGRKLNVQYNVRSADDLTNSFQSGYPQEYQPRQTDRAASEQRIAQREGDMNFALMADSRLASDGAPITLPDGKSITRNHGLEAAKRGYAKGSQVMEQYRQDFIDHAEEYGLDPETVASTPKPVLERVITDKMAPAEIAAFAQEANMSSAARMSDAEVASALAKRMTGSLMDSFDPDESGKPNPEFVREVIRDLPVEEQGVFVDSSGRLSQTGSRMIRNAIFAKAYPDPRGLERMAESENASLKNITNGMLAAAPQVAQLQEAVARGDRFDLGIGPEIADSAAVLDGLVRAKTTVADWKAQGDMFGRNSVVSALVDIFAANRRSPKRIGEFLKEYTELAHEQGSPKQEGMFGAQEPPNKAELVAIAYDRSEARRNAQKDAFGDEADAVAPRGNGKGEAKGQAAGPDEPAGPQARAVGKALPGDQPLFPPESAEELDALQKARESAANKLTHDQLTAQMASGLAMKPPKLKPAQNRSLFEDEGKPEQESLFARKRVPDPNQLSLFDERFTSADAVAAPRAPRPAGAYQFDPTRVRRISEPVLPQEGASLAHVQAFWDGAQSYTRQVGGHTVLFVNRPAMDVVLRRMGPVGNGQSGDRTLGGILVPSEWANVVAEARAAKADPRDGGFDNALVRLGDEIAERMGTSIKPLLIAQTGLPDQALKRIVEEEVDHASHLELPGGLRGLPVEIVGTPGGQAAAEYLATPAGGNYPKLNKNSPFYEHDLAVITSEIGVRLMRPDRWQELGATAQEAGDLADAYVRGLEKHGEKATEIIAQIRDAQLKGETRPPARVHRGGEQNQEPAVSEKAKPGGVPGRTEADVSRVEASGVAAPSPSLPDFYARGKQPIVQPPRAGKAESRIVMQSRKLPADDGSITAASVAGMSTKAFAKLPIDHPTRVNAESVAKRLNEESGTRPTAPTNPPPAPPSAVGRESPREKLTVSPSYDQTKANILAHVPVAERPELEKRMNEWEAAHPDRKVVGFKEIENEARALDPRLVMELKSPGKGQTLDPALRFAAREALNGINDEAVRRAEALSKSRDTMDPAKIIDEERKIEGLKQSGQDLLDVLIATRSQDGRNLAYHAMIAQKSFSDEYWIGRARTLAGGTLPPKTMEGIKAALEEGRDAEKAVKVAAPGQATTDAQQAVTDARFKLATRMMKVERTGVLDTISALRKAGLLTGLKTSARNIGGNTAFQVMEETARLPAAILDSAMSIFSGNRTVQGPSPRAVASASYQAATKGILSAVETMRHGATKEQLSKMDIPREVNSGSKVIDTYTNTVFRFMSAQDQVFRKYAIDRSLSEQAALMEKNGKGKAEYWKKNPTTDMQARAVADSEYSTFNNKNMIADALSSARGSLRRSGTAGRVADFAIDMVVPFAKTPANIIARMFDYTPLGPAARVPLAIGRSIAAKNFTPEQQSAIAMSIGRGLTGSALIYMGAKLYQNGQMTGVRNPEASARDEAVGREPGAILVDGKWRQVASFSPAGNLATLGASIAETATKPLKDEAKRPEKYALIATKTIMEQPFLKGMNDLIEGLNSPGKRATSVAASMAGSFVPTMAADVAAAADTVRRKPEGIVEGIKVRIPGLRNTLPVRRDVLGRTLTQDSTFDPTMPSAARELTDPLARELVRTQVNISKAMQRPESVFHVNGKTFKETAESRDEYQLRAELVGRLMNRIASNVVQSARYQEIQDVETRRLILEKAIHMARMEMSKVTGNPNFKIKPAEERATIWKTYLHEFEPAPAGR